jgi:hypothetical protein
VQPLGHFLQVPAGLASKWILRSGSIPNEALGLARDIVLTSEGALAWIVGLTFRSRPDRYAAEVAPDPFASPWDEVVRSPQSRQRHPSRILGLSGHGPPAA